MHTKDNPTAIYEKDSGKCQWREIQKAGVWYLWSEKGGQTEDLTFVMLILGRRGVNCISENFLESCVHSVLQHSGDWQVISIAGVIRQLGGHSVFLQKVIWGKLRGIQGSVFSVANTHWPQCIPLST